MEESPEFEAEAELMRENEHTVEMIFNIRAMRKTIQTVSKTTTFADAVVGGLHLLDDSRRLRPRRRNGTELHPLCGIRVRRHGPKMG